MHDSWNWFRAICLGMIWLLEFFHGWVGSWGWAIVALTVTMKIITHPINHRALRINAEFQRQMAKIKPELDALTEEHKDKPQEKMMAQQRLMKKHGINPFAPMKGCFPMLLQIPIFFALYRIIGQSISLRGESFLWIDDLAAPDALVQDVIFGMDLNLLPLLMVATQILSMLLSSRATATDPNQRMIMFIMPIMMLLFLYNFASGLFVYWVAQNCWQIGHTLLTNKEVEHEAEEREHQQEEEEKTKAAALTTSASKNRRKKKAATANANK
jgi:YidC/Oxa1 family membrane protein insertase